MSSDLPHRSAPVVPSSWMPDARIERIIVHWTAGQHEPKARHLDHYHLLITGQRQLVRGKCSIAANGIGSQVRPRASHTLNRNTGSIGLALCGMAGAREFPFSAGRHPITVGQWVMAGQVVADLCQRYSIPVDRRSVLTHAEVQGTLGIKQRGKWDITRLPWNRSVIGAAAVGDEFRAMVMLAISPNKRPAKAARPLLAEGASGDAVLTLQRFLNAAGFYVALDSQFGPITDRAVNAFQKATALNPDGIVGPATWRKLEEDTQLR